MSHQFNLADMVLEPVDIESSSIAAWFHDKDDVPITERFVMVAQRRLRRSDYVSPTTVSVVNRSSLLLRHHVPSNTAQARMEHEYQWLAYVDGGQRRPTGAASTSQVSRSADRNGRTPPAASSSRAASDQQNASRHNSNATTTTNSDSEFGIDSIGSLTSMTTDRSSIQDSSHPTDDAIHYHPRRNPNLPYQLNSEPSADIPGEAGTMGPGNSEPQMAGRLIIRAGSDANQDRSAPQLGSIECLFKFLGCRHGFDDVEEWKTHCTWHLRQRQPPTNVKCGGCPAGPMSWLDLLSHLVRHVENGQSLRSVVPHDRLCRYLLQTKIIDKLDYRALVLHGHPDGGFDIVDSYHNPAKERKHREDREGNNLHSLGRAGAVV